MGTTFHKLRIENISKEASKTACIAFNIPSELKTAFEFKAGQYLTIRSLVDGEDLRRSYSLCSSPSSNKCTVAVKAIENGKFSNFAYDTLKEGDELEVMEPAGNFTVDNSTNNHVFFAAGSGITPVISMVKDILENGKGKATLFYGNRSAEETIFKSELDALNNTNENFELVYIYSRQDSGQELTNGRITGEKCLALHTEKLNNEAPGAIYSCGPEEMINAVKSYFLGTGLDASKIHFELFTTPVAAEPVKPVNPGAEVDSNVTVIIDDEEYKFTLNTGGKDILQTAQDKGADVPFSCKGGVCCTCRAKIMEGTASMDMNFALEESEIEEGFILTCQAHPTSEKLVVSFDEF